MNTPQELAGALATLHARTRGAVSVAEAAVLMTVVHVLGRGEVSVTVLDVVKELDLPFQEIEDAMDTLAGEGRHHVATRTRLLRRYRDDGAPRYQLTSDGDVAVSAFRGKAKVSA